MKIAHVLNAAFRTAAYTGDPSQIILEVNIHAIAWMHFDSTRPCAAYMRTCTYLKVGRRRKQIGEMRERRRGACSRLELLYPDPLPRPRKNDALASRKSGKKLT